MRPFASGSECTSVFESLAEAHSSNYVGREQEGVARIRGFEAAVRRLKKGPELVRYLLNREFSFEGEVDMSVKGAREDEALERPWFASTFVIPNTSNMERWTEKFVAEQRAGRTVVALVPARTYTDWFHSNVIPHATEIRFLKGRLTYADSKSPSAFPDLIAVYAPRDERAPRGGAAAAPVIDVTTGAGRSSGVAIYTSFTGEMGEGVVVRAPGGAGGPPPPPRTLVPDMSDESDMTDESDLTDEIDDDEEDDDAPAPPPPPANKRPAVRRRKQAA